MKTYQEIIAPLSEEDKLGLSHHMRLVTLGCYICDDPQEAYDALMEADGETPASDVVTLWEPLENEDWTVQDLINRID